MQEQLYNSCRPFTPFKKEAGQLHKEPLLPRQQGNSALSSYPPSLSLSLPSLPSSASSPQHSEGDNGQRRGGKNENEKEWKDITSLAVPPVPFSSRLANLKCQASLAASQAQSTGQRFKETTKGQRRCR